MMRPRRLLLGGSVGTVACAAGLALVACGSRTGELSSLEREAVPEAGAGSPEGATSSSGAGAVDATPEFPTGVYACGSTLNATGTYQDIHFESVAGGEGTLTVTQSGPIVTAAYTGDLFVTGTLRFVATTDGYAEPATPGQTLTVECPAPFGSPVDQPLSIASGSLTMDGTTLFLSFSGTALPGGSGASACDGVTMPGTLTCSTEQ